MNYDFVSLRNKIKSYMSEKRYIHTLGVEKAARRIAEVCLPSMEDEIAVAALLHDIAKELPSNLQCEYAQQSGFSLTDDDIETLPALHSFAAPYVIKRDFSDLATENILSATFNHTVGAPDISLFDEIIFVADYVEENREYSHCKQMRELLFGDLNSDFTTEQNLSYLHKVFLAIIDFTIHYLSERGMKVNGRTLLTKNAFSGVN